MIIESYSFGEMKVNDNIYTSDIIIFPEIINPSWWRKEGHYLQMTDVSEIIDKKPERFTLHADFKFSGSLGIIKKKCKIKFSIMSLSLINNLTPFFLKD